MYYQDIAIDDLLEGCLFTLWNGEINKRILYFRPEGMVEILKCRLPVLGDHGSMFFWSLEQVLGRFQVWSTRIDWRELIGDDGWASIDWRQLIGSIWNNETEWDITWSGIQALYNGHECVLSNLNIYIYNSMWVHFKYVATYFWYVVLTWCYRVCMYLMNDHTYACITLSRTWFQMNNQIWNL